MIPSASSALTERLFKRDLKVNAVGNVLGSRMEKTARRNTRSTSNPQVAKKYDKEKRREIASDVRRPKLPSFESIACLVAPRGDCGDSRHAQVGTAQFGDNMSPIENQYAVACTCDFFKIRRDEQHGVPFTQCFINESVDINLGADIDAKRRFLQDQNRCSNREPAGQDHFLLIPARSKQKSLGRVPPAVRTGGPIVLRNSLARSHVR